MARLQVRDLMTEKLFTLHPNDDIQKLRELMDERNVRHVPVVDDDRNIVGLVSERDLLRSIMPSASELPVGVQGTVLRHIRVGEVMTTDVETVEADQDVSVAAQIMLDNKYGCLPVADGTRLEGILTESDFVKYLADRG